MLQAILFMLYQIVRCGSTLKATEVEYQEFFFFFLPCTDTTETAHERLVRSKLAGTSNTIPATIPATIPTNRTAVSKATLLQQRWPPELPQQERTEVTQKPIQPERSQ